MKKILVINRESLVARGVFSLSVDTRITDALDYLKDRGLIEFCVFSEHDPLVYKALDWCDVIFFSKHSSKLALDIMLEARKRNIRSIYDIDDWIFSFPDYSGGKSQSSKLENIKKLVAAANNVTVANKVLMDNINGKFCDNACLVPNGMYVEKYIDDVDFDNYKESEPPKIVFTNADFLKIRKSKNTILNVFQEFFYKHKDFRLIFYGDPFPEMTSLSFMHYTNRIPYYTYMRALFKGNYVCAITPLGGEEDSDCSFFNSCKNPFKYLNYGAAGVPGIYSNAEIYKDCVIDGKTGLKTDNTKEGWNRALDLMISDFSLRQKIRKNAFNDIMQNYHIRFSAEKFYALFSA
ncbi:MAG: glycosyltransferase family 1 protein [Deferribacterales bacterium]